MADRRPMPSLLWRHPRHCRARSIFFPRLARARSISVRSMMKRWPWTASIADVASRTVLLGLRAEISPTRSSPSLIARPLALVIMSPGLSPALSAGIPDCAANDDARQRHKHAAQRSSRGLERDPDRPAYNFMSWADERYKHPQRYSPAWRNHDPGSPPTA